MNAGGNYGLCMRASECVIYPSVLYMCKRVYILKYSIASRETEDKSKSDAKRGGA